MQAVKDPLVCKSISCRKIESKIRFLTAECTISYNFSNSSHVTMFSKLNRLREKISLGWLPFREHSSARYASNGEKEISFPFFEWKFNAADAARLNFHLKIVTSVSLSPVSLPAFFPREIKIKITARPATKPRVRPITKVSGTFIGGS